MQELTFVPAGVLHLTSRVHGRACMNEQTEFICLFPATRARLLPMKRLLSFLLVLLCIFPAAIAKGTSGRSSRSGRSSASKTEHVSGYYRKDGTYVRSYDRSAPGTASGASSYSASATYTCNHLAQGFTADSSVQRNGHGKIKRSRVSTDAKSPAVALSLDRTRLFPIPLNHHRH